MNTQVKTYNVCGLAEDLLINLPIKESKLEYHPSLDKLVFIFEDMMGRLEIEGDCGVSILVCSDKLIGFIVGDLSRFKLSGFNGSENIFLEICFQYPDFASALYNLVGSFEMSKI